MTTEHVWDTYADQLRRYIQARVQGPAVDDILQQVFLIVHEKLETLQNKEALKSRLYRVTQNTIIDWYRKVYGDKDGQFDEGFWDTLEDPIENDQDAVLVRKVSSCLLPIYTLGQESSLSYIRTSNMLTYCCIRYFNLLIYISHTTLL